MISRMIVDAVFVDKNDPSSNKQHAEQEPFANQSLFQEQHRYRTADAYIGKTERIILNVMIWTISIMISVLAFWLSWSCNTAMGYHVALKAMYGALAFFFGTIYIIMYFVMRWDVCYAVMYNKKR